MTSLISLIRNTCFLALTAFINPAPAANHPYSITNYTDEHGLPQNSVKGISPDNLGFIWLITENGPVRYDGNGRFAVFDSLSTALRSARMSSLTNVGTECALWAQTALGEMLLLKNGRATRSDKSYWDVFPKPTRYPAEDIDAAKLPETVSDNHPKPRCLPDSPNSCYMVTSDSVLYFNDFDAPPAATHHLPGNNPWLFAVHRGKLLYIDRINRYTAFTDGVPAQYRELKGDLKRLPDGTPFKVYWNTAAHQLFIYAANNLYVVEENDRGELLSTKILADFSFEEHRIIVAYYMQDKQQVLLGSATKGLFAVKRKLFNTVTPPRGSGQDTYHTQTLLADGLVLTDKGKAFDLSGGFQLKKELSHIKGPYNHVVGPNGQPWVLQEDTILIYNAEVTQLVRRLPNPTKAKVILKGDSTTYWLGGDQGIIVRYDATDDRFTPIVQLPQPVSYLETGNGDTLYVGTRQGLYAVHMDTYNWKEIPEFRDKFIRSIYRENNRRLWVCTYQQGVSLYEQGKVTHFPLDRAGYLATAHCILEDREGFFWISTNKGLFHVNKEQLLEYSNDKSKAPFYFYYNKTDGFTTNEFNGGCQPCAIQLADGRFSYPSLEGLVWFDPLTIPRDFPSGAIILDEVKRNEESLPIGDTIVVSNGFSRLTIKIATPFYGNPANASIDYRLADDNQVMNEWLAVNRLDQTLSINELASGSHDIYVRMRTGPGRQDYRYARFHLYIPPLFHETGWFTLLSCAFIGLTIWLIIVVRTRIILNQNSVLLAKVSERTDALRSQYEWQERLSASIAHDIKSPLNYIVKALSNMRKIAERENFLPMEMESVYQSVKSIYHYSNNLTKLAKISLTKETVEFTAVDLFDIAEQQIDIFRSVAESRGNTLRNDIPAGTWVCSHADILSVIIHNLLDNATKFTQNGNISLKTTAEEDGPIALMISDTGVGFSPAQIRYYNRLNRKQLTRRIEETNIGLGLLLVRDMANLIGTEMSITSALGKGTTITFILCRNHSS